MPKDDDDILIPPTINQVISGLKDIAKQNKLTGEEIILDTKMVRSDTYEYPAGTILFKVADHKKSRIWDEHDPEIGEIYLYPRTFSERPM